MNVHIKKINDLGMNVLQDANQLLIYDIPGFPVYVRKGNLSFYPEKRALNHWHREFEVLMVLEGCMLNNVNGKDILLQEGDGILAGTP